MKIAATLSIALLALAGCSNTSTQANAGKKSSDLEQAVKNELATNPDLANNISVSADAEKNEVTLSGTVPTEELRSQALSLAKTTQSNLSVVDKVEVKPPEIARSQYTEDMARRARENAKAAGDKLGKSLDDAWIHTKISSQLIGNSVTSARKVNIDVNDDVVTLRGEVDSPQAKADAGRIATDTDGVKRVNNLLKVAPSQ